MVLHHAEHMHRYTSVHFCYICLMDIRSVVSPGRSTLQIHSVHRLLVRLVHLSQLVLL
jgi:hypothetical protein